MNPSWVNFYYVKPDLLIKLFEIEIEFREGSFISSFENFKSEVDDRGHRLRITHT